MTETYKVWNNQGYDAAMEHVHELNTAQLFNEEHWALWSDMLGHLSDEEKAALPNAGTHRVVITEIHRRFIEMENELQKLRADMTK